MRYLTAIIGIVISGSCYIDCNGEVYRINQEENNGQGYGVRGTVYVGCYADTADRDLQDVLIRDYDGNTPEKCINLCKTKGFMYAAVQAGYACLCGNSYGKHGSISESKCQLSCSGDKTETCGGSWANAIYKISQPGVRGTVYVGCYADTADRDLQDVLIRDYDGNTPEKCINLCKTKGFMYAAVQAGYACLCGNSYGKHGSISESKCQLSCSGDKTQTCGGSWANAIYKISQPGVMGTVYVGCYADTADRDLQDLLIRDYDGNTPQKCINLCKTKGFMYAGVQAGYACLCGNSYGKHGSISESKCQLSCSGDKTQKCGGSWANAIYRISQPVYGTSILLRTASLGVTLAQAISDDQATDILLHRNKRGLGSVLVYGTSILLRTASLGVTLAQAISGGCATFPSICRDKKEIEKLDNEIKDLRIKYDQKYLENKKAYLDLRTANTDNAYIMYYINETIQAIQSLEEYQDKIAQTLEIELHELYQRFQANPNSTVYLTSLIGELEYSLSDIRNMIESKKNSQIIGLVVQSLVEFSLTRFVNAYSRAYSQITAIPEDIYATTVWTAMFTADATDAGIMLDPNHPRFEEVMANHGVPTSDRVTLKQKFKYTPKVFKQMWTNMKNKFNNLGTSLRKWKRIRNWQGFKGKLKHSLRGPTEKVNNVKKFASSKATRKLFVRNYKLSWSQGGMMAIGIIGDAVSIAVQTHEWKTVADEMKKARGKYEEYRNNLRNELQSITDQTKEIADHWPEIIDAFNDLSLSFKSLIDNITEYEEFSDVLGLSKLPVDISSPLFSVDFNAVTKHNIQSAQGAVIGFMQEVDNDITRVADQMRARTILYDNVLKMTTDERAVQYMLDASHNVFKFSSSQTIKKFGEDLSKQDIVCTVSQLRKTRNQYDYYQLEPFRPRCDVSTTEFSNYETQAGLLRREQIMTSTVSHYRDNSLSTLLDLVHAAYRSSNDDDLRTFGSQITDRRVTCTVSKVFPSKQKFDFISLSPFRPDCTSVTAEDFQKMKAAARTIRATSAAVEGAMTTCTQFNFCPCPALIAQTNGISEADVIELIKALRPTLSRYCGTTGCDCVVL